MHGRNALPGFFGHHMTSLFSDLIPSQVQFGVKKYGSDSQIHERLLLNDEDDQSQFSGRGLYGGIFHKSRSNTTYDSFGATKGVKKWKIVEWNHSGIWK